MIVNGHSASLAGTGVHHRQNTKSFPQMNTDEHRLTFSPAPSVFIGVDRRFGHSLIDKTGRRQ
jgi:hypothetical protein